MKIIGDLGAAAKLLADVAAVAGGETVTVSVEGSVRIVVKAGARVISDNTVRINEES